MLTEGILAPPLGEASADVWSVEATACAAQDGGCDRLQRTSQVCHYTSALIALGIFPEPDGLSTCLPRPGTTRESSWLHGPRIYTGLIR